MIEGGGRDGGYRLQGFPLNRTGLRLTKVSVLWAAKNHCLKEGRKKRGIGGEREEPRELSRA